MKCSEILNMIDDYYDDLLSDDSRIEIDKHLGTCFECNSAYTELNNFLQQLKSFSNLIERPLTLQKEIAEELNGEKPPEEIVPKKKGFRLFRRG